MGRAVFTAVASLYALTFFLVSKVVVVPTGAAALAWKALGLGRVVKAAPLASVLVVQAAALMVASDFAGRWFDTLPFGVALRVAALWWLSGGLMLGAAWVAAVPSTLEGIERDVAARWPERWFARRLRTPIDAIFVRLVLASTVVAVPPFVGLLVPGWAGFGWLAALFVVAQVSVGESHELLDHTNLHNGLFSVATLRGWPRWVVGGLSFFLEWVLNPICNRPPHWYRVQHLAMHHVENGGVDDLQSVVTSDRTSAFAFCRSALVFGLEYLFSVGLVRYLWRTGRTRHLAQLVRGQAVWVAALGAIAWLDWRLTLLLVVGRFLSGAQAASLNFYWHALADPESPGDVYRNAVNALPGAAPSVLGQSAHIEHHLAPGRHWSKLAPEAEAALDAHARHGALYLNPNVGNHYLAHAWQGRFLELAAWFEAAGGGESKAWVAATLEARLKPLKSEARAAWVVAGDRRFGRVLAALL